MLSLAITLIERSWFFRLDSKLVRLEASFAEPLYERFSANRNGANVVLLAFTRPTSSGLKDYLTSIGAIRDPDEDNKCYSEVWLFDPSQGRDPKVSIAELDMLISQAIGVLGGRLSSLAGTWQFPHNFQLSENQQWRSRVLTEWERSNQQKSRESQR